MEDCLFCKIAAGDIPSKKLYEDEQVVAFYDIAPQAKVHFLVIPKKHIPSAAALTEEDGACWAMCLRSSQSSPGSRASTTATVSSPMWARTPARPSSICTSMFWAARSCLSDSEKVREIVEYG